MADGSTALALAPERELDTAAMTTLDQARALVIADQDDYDFAAARLKGIRALQDRLDAHYDPAIAAAHAAHKASVAMKAEHAKPLEEARKAISSKMGAWKVADDERRRAEAARREEEARRAAETERLATAEALDKAGRKEEAEAALTAPVMVPTAPVEEAPRTEGVSVVTRWRAEVADMAAFVRWIAANPGYVELVKPDSAKLNALARSTHGKLAVPGVRFVSDAGVAVRG
jgi:hypothetical protein